MKQVEPGSLELLSQFCARTSDVEAKAIYIRTEQDVLRAVEQVHKKAPSEASDTVVKGTGTWNQRSSSTWLKARWQQRKARGLPEARMLSRIGLLQAAATFCMLPTQAKQHPAPGSLGSSLLLLSSRARKRAGRA